MTILFQTLFQYLKIVSIQLFVLVFFNFYFLIKKLKYLVNFFVAVTTIKTIILKILYINSVFLLF